MDSREHVQKRNRFTILQNRGHPLTFSDWISNSDWNMTTGISCTGIGISNRDLKYNCMYYCALGIGIEVLARNLENTSEHKIRKHRQLTVFLNMLRYSLEKHRSPGGRVGFFEHLTAHFKCLILSIIISIDSCWLRPHP